MDSAGAWQQCARVCVCTRVCVHVRVHARVRARVRVHACVCARVCAVLRCSVVSHSLQPHELQPTRLLRPWDSPGKNPGAGCHALLQGIFPTQGLHPHLLHWQVGSSLLGHLGSPWLQREVPVMTRRDSVCPGQSPGQSSGTNSVLSREERKWPSASRTDSCPKAAQESRLLSWRRRGLTEVAGEGGEPPRGVTLCPHVPLPTPPAGDGAQGA